MYLLDSNILIYSVKKEHLFLRTYITDTLVTSAVSVATVIEVLGYHRLTTEDKKYFESCFALLDIFEVTKAVSDKAVQLRQQQKLSLGDSIIAATALVYDYELITRNIDDFKTIPTLKLVNPFA